MDYHIEAKTLIDTLPELSKGNAEQILSAIDGFAKGGEGAKRYTAALMRAFLER
jgi:hypothetical protein